MEKDYSITKWFGPNLAVLLSDKITEVYRDFDREQYIRSVERECPELSYTQRIDLHATQLKGLLPEDYPEALSILTGILGEENPHETGMFKEFYWVLPIGKFIEKYGLDHYEPSMRAIEEVTKRNTGEYAVRPFIRKYPKRTIEQMNRWAEAENFHLRRLAAEGSRPKLPWASKLETFVQSPQPVFGILRRLKEEKIRFVRKSVANNIADYLKVNYDEAARLVIEMSRSENTHTRWIVKYATRKTKVPGI